jgi:methyl-accepting chemotaxis protein
MENIKIGAKMIAAFILIAVLAAAMGIYLMHNMNQMDEDNDNLFQHGIVPLSLLVKTAEQSVLLFVHSNDFKLAKTEAERNAVVKNFEGSQAVLKDILSQQSEKALTNDIKSNLRNLQAALDEYSNEFQKFARAAAQNCPPPGECLIDFPATFQKASGDVMKWGGKTIEDSVAETKKISSDISALFDKAFKISIIVLIAVILISIFIGLYLTFSITNPLKIVVSELSKMENGDMTVRSHMERGDELGMLAKATDSLSSKFQHIMKSLRENSETLAGASEELSTVSRQLASGSEETVAQSNTVASTTEQMAVNINAMASGAEQASVNANEVAGAAEQMSTNMNTVASAIEEMSSSINQIASNAGEARKVAIEATGKASNATGVMSKLGSAAKEIGQVTDVIKKIADKTNLLALNATIEAASAGEAGKGFAVVASEIKELANQSAISADDITRRIEGIQTGTGEAVNVINDVSDIIAKINHSVEAIAGHVEQQTHASNEIANSVAQANTGAKRVASAIGEVAKGANDMSRNAGEAAKGATNVSHNVAGVSQVAKDTAQGAGQVNQSASDLSRIASDLKNTVSQFKV